MASYSSVFVCNVGFLLFSILLVSTSAEQSSAIASIIPSVDSTGTPSDNYLCDTNANVYTTQIWGPTKDCFLCTPYCYGACDSMRTTTAVTPSCTWISGTNVKCECCCVKPKSPPPPVCPPPAPLPPPPPCPSPPSSDKCDTGDDVTETTMPSSNCADCTNWCNNDCSELGGRVIQNKCAIGESKFVRRCSCCCRGGKSVLKLS